MDNSKKNVHSSGPLGMLVKTGQVKKVDTDTEPDHVNLQHVGLDRLKTTKASYFRTQAGIEFKENELIFVSPEECEPWEYANRSEDEMGEMEELVRSIKETNQLQPALIRSHPAPHGKVKYQIIFGRRRHAACLQLEIPFLVIKKDSLSKQEAIACQDAENKFRKNVSNYSNSLLYKKLLEDGTFKSAKELAEKLGLSTSSLNDLMSYIKIPSDLSKLIPDLHSLSVNMALKVVKLINYNKNALDVLKAIAPDIGKSITSSAKLERTFLSYLNKTSKSRSIRIQPTTTTIQSDSGKKMFTLKTDQKGLPCIVFNRDYAQHIDLNKLCLYLKKYIESDFEDKKLKSGYPDFSN